MTSSPIFSVNFTKSKIPANLSYHNYVDLVKSSNPEMLGLRWAQETQNEKIQLNQTIIYIDYESDPEMLYRSQVYC